MILDTSYLIDLMAGDDDAHGKGRELVATGEPQLVPAVVAYELRRGAVKAGSDDERRRVNNVLDMYTTVPLRTETAERAGLLHGEADLDAGGNAGLDQVYPMIAAVAAAFDDAVLTDNADDFRSLGVPVETY